jgi:hypothetical protein
VEAGGLSAFNDACQGRWSYAPELPFLNHHQLTTKRLSLLFDVIADLPEYIAVMPVFAAAKHEALSVLVQGPDHQRSSGR